MQMKKISHSEEETQALARDFAQDLQPGDILLFEGDLGAGKTSFIQGLALGLGVPETVMTHSPTFTLVNQYPGRVKLVHIDLYRIDHPQQLLELGIEEFMEGDCVLAVEWASKAPDYWPASAIRVALKSLGSHSREIVINKG